MWRIAALIHLIGMTVLMGALVTVIVSVPALYERGMQLIPIAAVIGFIVAIPASIWAARKIVAATGIGAKGESSATL